MTFKQRIQSAMVGLALAGSGCATVQGSAVATGGAPAAPNEGPVQLVMLTTPATADEVGVIQARGHVPIDELAPEFVAQASRLGGNVAKVDTISTKFEMVQETETYSYGCGKSTCTGSRLVQREVATTQMVGRAFRRRNP